MIRSLRHRLRLLGVLALLGLLALGGATGARAQTGDPDGDIGPAAAPAPSLTDVSATTQTAALFTVTGRVYLAVYDQMGAKLFETRWITASYEPGGGLREAFGGLCGATAMVRALDEQTAVWSNWLPVSFACASSDGPYQRGMPY